MEFWDIYDCYGNLTDRKVKKGESLGKDDYHLAMEAWIINSEKQILIQQRSNQCEILPGIWGLTTGRMVSGENTDTGCIREIKEELGIPVLKEDITFLRRIVRQDATRLIWDIYLVRKNYSLEALKLQKEEVARVKWVSVKEFIRMLEEGVIFRYPEIYEVLSAVEGAMVNKG